MAEDPVGPSSSDSSLAASAAFRVGDLDFGPRGSLSQASASNIEVQSYNPIKETDTARKYIGSSLFRVGKTPVSQCGLADTRASKPYRCAAFNGKHGSDTAVHQRMQV